MDLCLVGHTALEFWRSSFACELAGPPTPFWEADTNDRPALQLPAPLPHAFLNTNIPYTAHAAESVRYLPKISSHQAKQLLEQGFVPPFKLGVFHENDRRLMLEAQTCSLSAKLPSGSFIKVAPDIMVASPPLCYLQYAAHHDVIDTLLLGFELCGYYALSNINNEFQPRKALCTSKDLARYLSAFTHVPGIQTARDAARFVRNGSASPMETASAALFLLPFRLGGLGQRNAQLNANIILPGTHYGSSSSLRTCDLLFKDALFELEYNDKENHGTTRQRTKDARRTGEMRKLGIICEQITLERLQTIPEMESIACEIAKRAGRRFQPRTANYKQKQFELFCRLVPGFAYANRFDDRSYA